MLRQAAAPLLVAHVERRMVAQLNTLTCFAQSCCRGCRMKTAHQPQTCLVPSRPGSPTHGPSAHPPGHQAGHGCAGGSSSGSPSAPPAEQHGPAQYTQGDLCEIDGEAAQQPHLQAVQLHLQLSIKACGAEEGVHLSLRAYEATASDRLKAEQGHREPGCFPAIMQGMWGVGDIIAR